MVRDTARFTQSADSSPSLKILLVLGSILILGAITLVGSVVINPPAPATPVTPPNPTDTPLSTASLGTQTIVYGQWLGGKSVISAVNTDGSNNSPIAQLPLNIKDVNIIDAAHLLYIGDVGSTVQDHGTQIGLYDLTNKQTQILYSTTTPWGIDDVVISPDKGQVAWWEVQLAPAGTTLLGGKSRVYTSYLTMNSNLTPQLVYNESVTAGSPIHYPLFFDHNNRLYADTFVANDGGHWNLGLSHASPPTKPEVLADELYNLDPKLHPTRNLIVYTGYDPTRGLKLSAPTDPAWAEEARNANTVKLFDLNNPTLGETILVAEAGRFYAEPTWSYDGNSIFVKSFTPSTRLSGTSTISFTDPQLWEIDITTKIAQQVPRTELPSGVILTATPDGLILGEELPDPANLGSNYSGQLATISIYHADRYAAPGTNLRVAFANGIFTTLAAGNVQFVGFASRQATQLLGVGSPLPQQEANTLKLQALILKPELNFRTTQQNDVQPKPGIPQGLKCKELWKMEYPDMQYDQFKSQIGRPHHKCQDSPLYLYAERPTGVQVIVKNATVLAAVPSYDPQSGWQTTATPSGTKIEYTYSTKSTPPTKGYLVTQNKIEEKLNWYAQKLGLQGQEITDFVGFWRQELPSAPYYFVSHFANPAQLITLEIVPRPDIKIQAIMYFKPLTTVGEINSYLPLTTPVFPQVPARSGFVAVDWSGEID